MNRIIQSRYLYNNILKRYYCSGNGGGGIKNKKLTVLGIETSCDDTSVSVVTSDKEILSQCNITQWGVHKEFGGVVPKLAKECHASNIDKAIESALSEAKKSIDDLDAIAVTMGPGIAFSLEVGLEKARHLAKTHSKAFLGVNHLEGHCLACRLSDEESSSSIKFPFIVLLVSGGHTQLLICHGVGKYTQIGHTLDDSIGEALDKAARELDCQFGEVFDGDTLYTGIHGGEAIEILARKGDSKKYKFSIPMVGSKNCDFSFSGLKTQLKKKIDQIKSLSVDNQLPLKDRCDLAASFQHASFMHLVKKTEKALDWYIDNMNKTLPSRQQLVRPSCLVVTGGVSKNSLLRSLYRNISKSYELPVVFPKPSLCTDNGAMIAWAGIEMLQQRLDIDPDDAFYLPVWPLDSNPPQLFQSNLKAKSIDIRKNWFKDLVEKYSPTGQLPLPKYLKQQQQQEMDNIGDKNEKV